MTEEEFRKAGTVFKSVFNFRNSKEDGYRDDTKLAAELGVEYHLLPFGLSNMDAAMFDKYLSVLDNAPKPAFLHCRSGFRAGVYGLNHVLCRALTTEKTAISKEQLMEEGKAISLDLNKYDSTALEFVYSYLGSKVDQALKLGGIRQVDANLFVGPQLSEKQFQEAKKQGIRTIVNLRDPSEAGSLGMGVLAQEEDLCKKLGLAYLNFPTKAQQEPTPDEMSTILKALKATDTQTPILLHCRTGRRSTAIALAYMSQLFCETYKGAFEKN